MTNLTIEQLKKLFRLAGMDNKQEADSNMISEALAKIECHILGLENNDMPDIAYEKGNILLIDDLETSIHHLSLILKKSGYKIYLARSKEEAFDSFKKHHFSFILLDLFLPEAHDGFDILEAFVSNDKVKENETKIILISGTDDKELINQAFLKGANEFIGKDALWHKKILKYIKRVEIQHENSGEDNWVKIENEDAKIVTILPNEFKKEITAKKLVNEFISLVNSGFINIIIDLKNISDVDQPCINAFLSGFKLCYESEGSLKLCNVSHCVNKTLSYVFLNNILPIYNNKDEAINSIKQEITSK
jgi:anti-sigma B factor antagonist